MPERRGDVRRQGAGTVCCKVIYQIACQKAVGLRLSGRRSAMGRQGWEAFRSVSAVGGQGCQPLCQPWLTLSAGV